MDKTAPTSFNFSFVTLAFFSFSFFLFFFLWFFQVVGSSSFPSFLFFLICIFIIFLRKHFWKSIMYYFLFYLKGTCGKFIQTLFSTKPKNFPSLHFSTLSTKHKWGKLKTFLSSHFSILPLFSILSLFHYPNQTDPK